MDYRQLGTSGVRVSPICLGAMNFGDRTTAEDGTKIIHKALDSGINFIDTANVYVGGKSEEVVGAALKGKRDDVVLATKVFGWTGSGPNDRGTSRRAIFRECDRSLKRLKTDWIDLYQLHRPDPTTPIEESLAALDDLVRMGKVRYIGISTFPGWRISEAQLTARMRGFVPITTEQPPYNLIEREIEKEVIPACKEFGIGTIPWSPLAGGMLSERFVGATPRKARAAERQFLDRSHWEPVLQAVEKLAGIAGEAGTSLSRFALAWLRNRETVVAPIIGPRIMKHLTDAIASLDVEITDELQSAVDEICPPGTSLWMEARRVDWGIQAQAQQAGG